MAGMLGAGDPAPPPTPAGVAPDIPLPAPRELWDRFLKDAPPFSFETRNDEVVPSATDPRRKLRRVEVRFASQVVNGKAMDHTAVIFIPLERTAERRGKAVVVGQRWGDASMLFNYGDPIATRTGYPTMVLPVPGEFDGGDGEGSWMRFLQDLVRETRDPIHHNYFRLAVPYLRALDVLASVLGETEIRAIIGGHSKRATSAFTAAAVDPGRIAGLVYMGNESRFATMGTNYLRCVSPAVTQRFVTCPVLYLGATNEDGYEIFNINRIQAVMERPWTIEYIPNYRHATASEVQFLDWQMWVAHLFDGRPLARIDDLAWERASGGTRFRARVASPNTIVQVKFWYVYCDDIPYWRDLVWYPIYPIKKGDTLYEGFLDGRLPDAWFVEVKDTAGGFPGYLSSLPQNLTTIPTLERVSHGWKSRLWRPEPARPGLAPEPPARDAGDVLEPIRAKFGIPALAGAIVKGERLAAIGAAGVRMAGSPEAVTIGDRFHVGSCTKSMTATLIGILVEHGKLSWKTSVGDVFPDLAEKIRPEYLSVTVDELLRHRSGLPEDRTPGALFAKIRALTGPLLEQRRKVVELALAEPPAGRAGSAMRYSNVGYVIAGAMAEAVTGRSWEDCIRDLVMRPLAIDSVGFGPPGTPGSVDQPRGHLPGPDGPRPIEPGPRADNPPSWGPAGTVHLTIGDWAKFIAFHLRGAQGKGRLLRPETFAALHAPLEGQDYALGWAVTQRDWAGGRVLTHNGSNTMWFAVVWIAPARDLAVLAVANQGGDAASAACDAAASALIRRAAEIE